MRAASSSSPNACDVSVPAPPDRGATLSRPRCPVCGGALAGRRSDARYCSGTCRAEASRLRRILSGQGADGYATLPDRAAAAQRRTPAPLEGVHSSATTQSAPAPVDAGRGHGTGGMNSHAGQS